MKTKYYLNLLVYPALQILFLALAMYFVKTNWMLALIMVVLSAIFMSFSLHITYHHHVHFKPKSARLQRLLDFVITAILGLPFHFYQFQHLNHHTYNNEVEDVTSTYQRIGESTRPRGFFAYNFLWFLNLGNLKNHISKAIQDGYFSESDSRKMRQESWVNLIVIVGLLLIGWQYALLFGIVFYLGWSMIALQNYGQHLPTSKHQIAFSYYGDFYNSIFMNNGLHYEHHLFPGQNYWELKPTPEPDRTNKWFHLIDGIRYIFSKS